MFLAQKMENEYVCPSESDESSENEQFCFLLQPNARVTAVSSPEEPPSCKNVVYSELETFQPTSSVQCELSSTDRCTPSWLKRQTNMLTVKSKGVSYVQDLFMVQETLHYTHIIWHVTVQNQLQLQQPQHVLDPLSLYSTYTCLAVECHVSLSNLLSLLLRN